MNNIEENSKVLRKFHNYVKFGLYIKYCKANTILLDLGCGRGGDMFKWQKVGIKQVMSIDINKNYIIDAIKRYKYNKANLVDCDYQFYFSQEKFIFTEFLQYRNLQTKYDNISCMFALHYFFNSKDAAYGIFEQISNSLIKGGHFFGTVMKGTDVHKYVKNKELYNTDAMFIKRDYNEIMNFGTKIQFMLSGTLYFGEKTLSVEYLIFENVLKNLGAAFNMKLVDFTCFEKYHSNEFDMSESFKSASFLNYTFAFEKI